MTQQEETVQQWSNGAIDAMDTCNKLVDVKKYHHALFFLHLALEKILKALIVKKLNDSPPPIHHLLRLSEIAGITQTAEDRVSLVEITTFNVTARYEETKQALYKKATPEYTRQQIAIGKSFMQRIISLL